MTEEEARDWLASRYPSDRIAVLEQYVALLLAEAQQQSLIARSTFFAIWSRHIVDSAQLLDIAPDGDWLDVGSGGGVPGLVIAILGDRQVTLSEPRRKRAEFLNDAISRQLALPTARVVGRAQDITGHFAVVSARAVAPIQDVLSWTQHVVSRETRYILQRGRNWQDDMALAQRAWHGAFHVEHSLTHPGAGIVIAHDVRRR